MAILPGKRLGPYEVLSAIGAGGMGEVYRARDTRLNRDVALKVIPENFSADVDRMARFEREAKLLASLNHPHIAAIYGLEEPSSTNALVMELVEGPTLADRIATGPIPLDEALPIAKQIAEALEYAHDKGVIHRDLKPANIKVTADGTVKVLDFGLAKALLDEPTAADPSNSPTLSMAATMAGMILGTAAYMSPEQAKGKPVDRRADIWAFGVVLFEMLTGKQVYTGENAAETLASVIKEEPPFARLPPQTPPAIRNLLRRCLEKNSRQRLQHIGEARIAIENAGAVPTEPVAAQPNSREWLAWSLTAILFTAALALTGVLLLQRPKPAPPLQAMLLPPKDHNFYRSFFALSPDGKKIAFVASDLQNGNRMLWVRSLDSGATQPLAGTDGAFGEFWSPDSRSIVFLSLTQSGEWKKIDVGGGPVITLLDIGAGLQSAASRGSWAPDGTIVFSQFGAGLYQVSSNGGPISAVTQLDAKRGETQHRWPFFLPDGRHLLFQATLPDPSTGGNVNEIRVLDLKTRKQKVLLRADSNAEYANGYLLYVQQGNLMAQPFDLSSLTVSGDSTPVAQQVQVAAGAMGAFSASPGGLLAFEGGDAATNQLVWYTRDGKEAGQVGSPGQYTMPSLSPDGTKAAASVAQGSRSDIWSFELARGIATRVTVDGMEANYPVWSADGSRVIYWDAERAAGIYSKPVSGLGGSELVQEFAQGGRNNVGVKAVPNSVSPDGKFLVYMDFIGAGTPRLWIHQFAPVKPDAKDSPLLGTNFPEAHAQFSPDGRWLSYVSEETGRGEVYVAPFPGLSSTLQISTSGGYQPRWRRDGKEIFYIAADGKMMAATVQVSGNSLKPDPPKALFQTRIVSAVRGYDQYDVTADGRKFLVNSNVEQSSEPITLYANWAAALRAK